MFNLLHNKIILGTILLLFSAILFGLEPIIAKPILAINDPMQVQFMRYFIAVIFLSPLLITNSLITKLTKKQILSSLLLGIVGMGIASPLFYLGLKLTTGLSAILIERSYPFLVFILAHFWLKEKLTARKIFGTILVMLGVLSIIFFSFAVDRISMTTGNLLVLGAMIIWSFWIILAKLFVKDIDPATLTISGFIIGLPVIAIYLKGNIAPIFTWQMLILGIIVALSWLFYFKGLKYITAIKATAIESSAPFFTAIFTVLILTRIPNCYEIVAIFLVIPGILLLAKEK